MRYTWLKKARDAVAHDPRVFLADDALVRLGVGKNMVKSIRHWGLATGVLEDGPQIEGTRVKETRVSKLGENLFGEKGWDPYLEDAATLWICHWQLASTPERSTTWYWLFNHQPTPEFTVEGVVKSLRRLADERGWPRLTAASLKRDVDCCVRTYCAGRRSKRAVLEDTLDSPLSELGLIRPGTSRDMFVLSRDFRPSLSSQIFAFALAQHLGRLGTSAQTVLLDDLMHQPGAPGRVFRLSEDGLLARVEQLEQITRGNVAYDETAGLKQIRIHKPISAVSMLRAHYRSASRRRN